MMEYHKLRKMNNGGGEVTAVCTQLSCQDPQVIKALCFYISVTISSDYQASLAGCIKSGDLNTFSALLADVAPLDDAKHLSLPDDEKEV